jgi:ATP-dependent RNA helicase TDRD9
MTLIFPSITGAFYPNYFIQTSNDSVDEREAFETLGGRDPCNSVYFSGFEPKYIGPLYQTKVKELFKDIIPNLDHIKVSFDNGTSKIYATIKNYEDLVDNGVFDDSRLAVYVPGRVIPEVYWAVKMRKLVKHQPVLSVMQCVHVLFNCYYSVFISVV